MFRVSKKLLRHYSEIGLLLPSKTDASNGYFEYGDDARARMKRILYLRSLRVPLREIKELLDTPEINWTDMIRSHLYRMRGERRVIERIETEIISLGEKLAEGREIFSSMEREKEHSIRVINLEHPVYVVGRATRVKYGSPEHMPAINGLIENFFGDDVPASIPDKIEPGVRFGICAEFSSETGEFTYRMGQQVNAPPPEYDIPGGTRLYTIPAGNYACITWSAQNIEATVADMPYGEISEWIVNSEEWDGGDRTAAYEVYDDERFEVPSWPEMDIWMPVKEKVKI